MTKLGQWLVHPFNTTNLFRKARKCDFNIAAKELEATHGHHPGQRKQTEPTMNHLQKAVNIEKSAKQHNPNHPSQLRRRHVELKIISRHHIKVVKKWIPCTSSAKNSVLKSARELPKCSSKSVLKSARKNPERSIKNVWKMITPPHLPHRLNVARKSIRQVIDRFHGPIFRQIHLSYGQYSWLITINRG